MSADERDRILIDLCLGLRTEREDAVQEALRSEGGRERVDELRHVTAVLDAAGASSRTVLATLKAMEAAPGEDRVESVLRGLAAESVEAPRPAQPSRSASFPWGTWCGAAAAALVAILALQFLHEPSPVEPRLLGGHALEIVAPPDGAEVGEALTFEWAGALEEGQEFRVRVYDGGDPLAFRPLLETRTTDHRWTPEPTEARHLPTEIRWTVERMDASGTVAIGSVEGSARRSR